MSLLPNEGQKSMFPMIEELRKEVERLQKENDQFRQQLKNCNLQNVNGCAFLEDIKSARNDALSRKIEMKNMGLSAKTEQGQLDALNWVIEKIEHCR